MFGTNEIVGKKYFEGKTDYFVTSIFYTIQGEGPLAGIPSVFIRLAKCNLNCIFCDSFFDDGTWMSIDNIHDRIEEILHEKFGDDFPLWVENKEIAIILTGGEPSLQNIKPLLESFFMFKYTQIESNGILSPLVPHSTIVVISPKCSQSNLKPLAYLKPNSRTLERANCLKFVMEADQNSPYSSIPDWALKWKEQNFGKEIYVSPMNIYSKLPAKSGGDLKSRSEVDEVISFWEPDLLNLKQNQANHEYAAEYAMKHGLRVSIQMHLYLSKA